MPNTLRERQVSVLFCSGRSIYAHLPGVDVWTRQRDAAKFAGATPVICHPPCRTWSLNLRHQAKPIDLEAEQNLGRFAVQVTMTNGGILEQPAGSKLWEDAKLPAVGEMSDPFCYTLAVEQAWWGFPTRKKTWLLVCGVPIHQVPKMPFQFDPKPKSLVWGNAAQRSRTLKPFAEWLCQVARAVWWREGEKA